MKIVEYGFAEFDRMQGRVDSLGEWPVTGARDGLGYYEFVEEAGQHGWELCGIMPGSQIGSKRAQLSGKRPEAKSEFEIIDLTFKRMP